jgi:hypothetical protein
LDRDDYRAVHKRKQYAVLAPSLASGCISVEQVLFNLNRDNLQYGSPIRTDMGIGLRNCIRYGAEIGH